MKKAEPKKPVAVKEETPKTDKQPATNEAKPDKKADSKADSTTQSDVQPPTPQTPKTSSWRKHEERMLEKQQQERQRQLLRQQQQEAYGYTPFKAPPYPIYDQRSQTPREFGLNPNYGLSRFESMQGQELGPPRPGTDMGMYKPARYQSYTTLPRPEQLEAESLYNGFRPPMSDVYGPIEKPELMNRPSSKMSRSYQMADPIKYRPGSAMSGRMSENRFTVANVSYGPHFPVIQGTYVKEIINWTGLNLCSYMQIICGICIFVIGVARLFMRAEYAKGQELFYGISVVTAGVFGYLAARHRNYCFAVSCFVHSLINALLAIVPLTTAILPIIPLLGVKNIAFLKDIGIQLSESAEPLEADFVLAVFSIVEFGVALFVAAYGCRSAGSAIGHIEQLRVQAIQQQSTKEMMN